MAPPKFEKAAFCWFLLQSCDGQGKGASCRKEGLRGVAVPGSHNNERPTTVGIVDRLSQHPLFCSNRRRDSTPARHDLSRSRCPPPHPTASPAIAVQHTHRNQLGVRRKTRDDSGNHRSMSCGFIRSIVLVYSPAHKGGRRYRHYPQQNSIPPQPARRAADGVLRFLYQGFATRYIAPIG